MRKQMLARMCVVVGSAAACGGDAAAAGPVVRDSAGIRIVQNDAPAWTKGQEWRVPIEPVLQVGVAEGDPNEQFSRVSDALRLSDGTLVVADGETNEIRAFDAQGNFLRVVARKGGGPGEIGGLIGMHLLPGDTFAAYDYTAKRLSYFSPAGAFVRAVTLRELNGKLPPRPLGVFSDGRMVVAPLYNPEFKPNPKPTRDTTSLALFSAAGTQTASLGSVPGDETVTFSGGSGNNRMVMQTVPPFGLSTHFAVHGTRLLVADPARYELLERRPDGAVARIIRRAAQLEPVTQADRDAYVERQLEGTSDLRVRSLHEEMLKNTGFPEHKPFLAGLRIDAAGNAWVQRPHAPETETPWDVFDTEGRLLGTVMTPAGVRVTQVGADFVVGIWSDELEVPHVLIHRLEKPALR